MYILYSFINSHSISNKLSIALTKKKLEKNKIRKVGFLHSVFYAGGGIMMLKIINTPKS